MTNKFLNNIKRDKQGGCMAILNYDMSEKIFLSEGAFLITTGLIIMYIPFTNHSNNISVIIRVCAVFYRLI